MPNNTTKKPVPQNTKTNETETTSRTSEGGFLLNAANWLLSRLPWFRDRYEQWSKTKRIIIGLLMYLIVLPVIPIVIAIIMYVRDPEGFKKSKAMPILGAVIIAWAGAFGLIAMQPPKVTEPNANQSSSTTKSTETKSSTTPSANSTKTPATRQDDSDTAANPSESKKKVQSKTDSEPTAGRQFENCDAAFDAGVFNISKSDPAYQEKLDRDNDGIACEK